MNSKKKFPLTLLVLFAVLMASNSLIAQEAMKPNIVFILADDLGIGDIGPYGQKRIQTPNIDLMASQGMKFMDFYAGSTVCAPSRACLMTGQHTGNTMVRGNGEFPIDPEVKILPEFLSEAGYTNVMLGKWGLGLAGSESSPEKRGWDYFVGHLHHVSAHFQRPDSLDRVKYGKLDRIGVEPRTYANDLFTREAVEFINQYDSKEPFFIYLSYTVPHAELVVPDRYLSLYLQEDQKSLFGLEQSWPEGRHYGAQEFPKAAYAALVTSIDDYLGMVLNALKAKGLDENTLVIFTSDNGTHIEGGRTREDVDFFKSSGDYKGVKRDLYSGGIKEPFIVRWPAVVQPGSVSLHRAAFWDILPTITELAGADSKNPTRDGISFVPVLKGKKQKKQHDYFYWEFHELGGKQALLQGDWKIIRLEVGKHPRNPVELYNVKNDPEEQNNLAGKFPGHAAKMTKLMDHVRTPNPDFDFGRK